MSPFKRLISAVEAAGQIMNKWSDEESNAVDMVILPPDNFDALTDEEEVQGDGVIIDNHNEVTFVVHSPPPPPPSFPWLPWPTLCRRLRCHIHVTLQTDLTHE